MDFPGSLITGFVTILGNVMIFLGVYKLFQISSALGEIKDLLKGGQRDPAGAPGPLPTDPATAYAENLLRAVREEPAASQTRD